MNESIKSNNEYESKTVSTVATPERAEAFSQAADLVGGITVNVLDPSIPEDADTYAMTSSQEEAAFYSRGERFNGDHTQPRSPEQIKKEVVEHALRAGKALVVIEYSQNDLSDFWKRVNQISE